MNNTLAINKLTDNFAKDPSKPEIAFNIGLLYMEDNEFERAVTWFIKAYTINPSYSEAYFFSAISNLLAEKYDKSINTWNLFIKAEKSPFDFYKQIKFPFSFDFERIKRKSFYSCTMRRNLLPLDTPPVYLSALTHIFLGDMESGISFLESISEKTDIPKSYYMLLSQVYEKTGQTEKAIEILEKFCKENKNIAGAFTKLASLYMEKGLYEKAKDTYLHSFEIKESAKTLVSVHEALKKCGKENLNILEGILLIDENNAYAYRELGKQCLMHDDIFSAFLFAKKAEELEENNSDTELLFGQIFLSQKDYRTSASHLLRCINSENYEQIANKYLAEAFAGLEEYEESAYRQTIYINKTESKDRNDIKTLAKYLEKAEMFEDSIAVLDELEKEENKKDIYKAIILLKKDEKDKAREFIAEYKKENSEDLLCQVLEFVIDTDKKAEMEDIKNILPQIPKILEEESELQEEDKKFIIYSFLQKI